MGKCLEVEIVGCDKGYEGAVGGEEVHLGVLSVFADRYWLLDLGDIATY